MVVWTSWSIWLSVPLQKGLQAWSALTESAQTVEYRNSEDNWINDRQQHMQKTSPLNGSSGKNPRMLEKVLHDWTRLKRLLPWLSASMNCVPNWVPLPDTTSTQNGSLLSTGVSSTVSLKVVLSLPLTLLKITDVNTKTSPRQHIMATVKLLCNRL